LIGLLRPGRIACASAVLGSLFLLVTPAPAQAHADLLRSTPRNGSVIPAPPRTITLTFGETVTLASTLPRLTDARGVLVPTVAQLQGPTLVVTPSAGLPPGPASLSYQVLSEDGHEVRGAIAFVVRTAGRRGPAQVISTLPSVPTRLSGSRPGLLTLTLSRPATSGEVLWTGPSGADPIRWRVNPRGRLASASGVLPTAGVWQMQATLEGQGFAVLVVRGTAALRP
jgi:methionine-rich copper-binding protein CopC